MSFSPSDVINLYNDLNKQIVQINGFVVKTNELLHNATGGSTNAVLLGSAMQIRGDLFYVAPYICKNKSRTAPINGVHTKRE